MKRWLAVVFLLVGLAYCQPVSARDEHRHSAPPPPSTTQRSSPLPIHHTRWSPGTNMPAPTHVHHNSAPPMSIPTYRHNLPTINQGVNQVRTMPEHHERHYNVAPSAPVLVPRSQPWRPTVNTSSVRSHDVQTQSTVNVPVRSHRYGDVPTRPTVQTDDRSQSQVRHHGDRSNVDYRSQNGQRHQGRTDSHTFTGSGSTRQGSFSQHHERGVLSAPPEEHHLGRHHRPDTWYSPYNYNLSDEDDYVSICKPEYGEQWFYYYYYLPSGRLEYERGHLDSRGRVRFHSHRRTGVFVIISPKSGEGLYHQPYQFPDGGDRLPRPEILP